LGIEQERQRVACKLDVRTRHSVAIQFQQGLFFKLDIALNLKALFWDLTERQRVILLRESQPTHNKS